jgi:hypothetical protein
VTSRLQTAETWSQHRVTCVLQIWPGGDPLGSGSLQRADMTRRNGHQPSVHLPSIIAGLARLIIRRASMGLGGDLNLAGPASCICMSAKGQQVIKVASAIPKEHCTLIIFYKSGDMFEKFAPANKRRSGFHVKASGLPFCDPNGLRLVECPSRAVFRLWKWLMRSCMSPA